MKLSRPTALASCVAALLMPAAAALSSGPTSGAASALFSEGATRPSGEAQTAFGGAFCEQNTCRSLGTGTVTPKLSSSRLQTAVDATPGDLILVGYSVGAAGIYDRLREWEKQPALAPDPARVLLIVTFGNPENKFGGRNRTNAGTGLPTEQPYDHLDVIAQYDGVADTPTRFGFYSAVNSALGQHFDYFEGLDINDPDNLVFQDGTTTYMLIPAETLPLVEWLRPFVSAERLAELDARYRPLVERDYDRPAYIPQGEGADWGNGNPPASLSESALTAQDLVAEPDITAWAAAAEEESDTAARRDARGALADIATIDNAVDEDVADHQDVSEKEEDASEPDDQTAQDDGGQSPVSDTDDESDTGDGAAPADSAEAA